MPDAPGNEAERFAESIPDLMSAFWEQLVVDDETELNVEQLSAYAEGRLSDAEREQVQRHLEVSPSSLETLALLHENVGQHSATTEDSLLQAVDSSSQHDTTVRASATPATEAPKSLRTNQPRVRLRTLVSAAAVAAAVGWAFVVTESRRELGEQYAVLESSLMTEQQQLALARKELLYANARQNRDLWSAGTMSPQMLQLALSESARSRGGETSEENERLDAKALDQATESLQRVSEQTISVADKLTETAALQLAAGQPAAAEKTIDEAQAAGASSPALENLRAVLLLARSNDPELGLDESDALINGARSTLKALLEEHDSFAPALFNLALLEQRYGDADAADDLWSQYLDAESSPELRDALQQSQAEASSPR